MQALMAPREVGELSAVTVSKPTWVPGLAWAEKGPVPVRKRATKARAPVKAAARRVMLPFLAGRFIVDPPLCRSIGTPHSITPRTDFRFGVLSTLPKKQSRRGPNPLPPIGAYRLRQVFPDCSLLYGWWTISCLTCSWQSGGPSPSGGSSSIRLSPSSSMPSGGVPSSSTCVSPSLSYGCG